MHINNNECDEFSNICSDEDSVTGDSPNRENTNTEITKCKCDRFVKLVNVQNSYSIANNSKQDDESEEAESTYYLMF